MQKQKFRVIHWKNQEIIHEDDSHLEIIRNESRINYDNDSPVDRLLK